MTMPFAAYLKISSSRPAKGRHGSAAEYPAWGNLTFLQTRALAEMKPPPLFRLGPIAQGAKRGDCGRDLTLLPKAKNVRRLATH